MNRVKVGATISDQDSHLGDTEGEGTSTIALRGIKDPLRQGKSKGRGGPATCREREKEEEGREGKVDHAYTFKTIASKLRISLLKV